MINRTPASPCHTVAKKADSERAAGLKRPTALYQTRIQHRNFDATRSECCPAHFPAKHIASAKAAKTADENSAINADSTTGMEPVRRQLTAKLSSGRTQTCALTTGQALNAFCLTEANAAAVLLDLLRPLWCAPSFPEYASVSRVS
jgi:hypothetical protein